MAERNYRRGPFPQVPHTPMVIPDDRIAREGTPVGYDRYGAPVYTWWNPETEAHECHILAGYTAPGPADLPHVGRTQRVRVS